MRSKYQKKKGGVLDKCVKGRRGAVGMLGRWEELKMGQETKGCEDGDAKGRSVEEESSGKFYEGRKG